MGLNRDMSGMEMESQKSCRYGHKKLIQVGEIECYGYIKRGRK